MTQYLTHFNQQWVGDHSSEWFASRGPLARAVVAEMKEAGVLVFAGGLVEEHETSWHADESGKLVAGPYISNSNEGRTEFIGGMTIIDVATEEEAKMWCAKIAVACGWPQELRAFKG